MQDFALYVRNMTILACHAQHTVGAFMTGGDWRNPSAPVETCKPRLSGNRSNLPSHGTTRLVVVPFSSYQSSPILLTLYYLISQKR